MVSKKSLIQFICFWALFFPKLCFGAISEGLDSPGQDSEDLESSGGEDISDDDSINIQKYNDELQEFVPQDLETLYSEEIEELFDNDPRFSVYTSVKDINSPKAISKQVDYISKKGILIDPQKKTAKFLGEGMLKQDNIILKAARIKYNWDSKILKAASKPHKSDPDDLGAPPLLTVDDHVFLARNAMFNLESEKAFASDIITPQEEGIITASAVKKATDVHFYVKDVTFSTCLLEHPHYHIYATRAKIIKDDRIITGPFNLYFGNMSTPLGYFYSVFRLNNDRASGFLFPDIGFKAVKGFYLNDFGYYFVINDYLGLAGQGGYDSETGDTYLKIPFEYHNRYKYLGTLSYQLNFEQFKDVHISKWKHATENKDGGKLTADVMIQIEDAEKEIFNRKYFDNNEDNYTNADITYTRDKLFGLPLSMSIALHHDKKFGRVLDKDNDKKTLEEKESEVDRTRIIIPSINISTEPLYIFNPLGTFDSNFITRTNVSYSIDFQYERAKIKDMKEFFNDLPNEIPKGKDTGDTHYGILHTIPISSNLTLLKYFTLTPSVTLKDRWYFEKFEYEYDPDKKEVVVNQIYPGFKRVGEIIPMAELETSLEARYQFGKHSPISSLRHKTIPFTSFTFSPGYSQAENGYFQRVYNVYDKKVEMKYAFDDVYGSPPANAKGLLGFGLKNILDLKVRDRESDSGLRMIKLLKNLDAESGYDFLAEKYKFQPITLLAATSFFKDHVNMKLTLEMDQYHYMKIDDKYEKIDDYSWNYGRGLGELRKATFDTEFVVNPDQDRTSSSQPPNPDRYVDFSIPWNVRFVYHIAYHNESPIERYEREKKERKQKLKDPNITIDPPDDITEHNIRFQGEMELTKKWKLTGGALYNIKKYRFEQPSIGVMRDLHCWILSINWNPLSYTNSLEFLLRVKANILQSIKYNTKGKL